MSEIITPKKRKAPRTAFKPGQCPNPSGRPKRSAEEIDLIAACKTKAASALNVICEIMQNGQQEKNKLLAAQYIIDRAFGKATQAVDMTLGGKITVNVNTISDEELASIAAGAE